MDSSVGRARIPLRGPYDLREVALMGYGHRDETEFDGVMRLAFCVDDDYETQVGVEVRQQDDALDLTVHPAAGGAPDLQRVAAQVARMVSADHDGEAYARLCRADPVLAPVFAVAPGFRPSLFASPYEAALWSVLSARRGRPQGIRTRARLAADHGVVFELAGRSTPAVPTPSALARVDAIPGLPADRIPRLHAIAAAAGRGDLEVGRLLALGPDQAMVELQRLPGIGPFYASLIVVRGLGLVDALAAEPQVVELATAAYGRPPATGSAVEDYAEIAEGWRPYRTWVAVMLRALSGRAAAA